MRRTIVLFTAVGISAGALVLAAQAQEAQQAGQGGQTEQAAAPAASEESQAKTLDELLELVRAEWRDERKENKEREARFRAAKDQQAKLLADAQALQERLEARSEKLEGTFEENERTLAALEETLAERMGTLGELFGVVRQVAGDARGNIESSLVSAEIGGRTEFLEELGRSKALPAIADLERLWYEMQREMTEQGKVVRFTAPVLNLDGDPEQREVIRAGVFSAISNGRYVLWEIDAAGVGRLRDLTKQPPARYLNTVSGFEEATEGWGRLAVDPSRGSLLALLIETPNRWERIQQGKSVGYVIIVLGCFALVLGIGRWGIVTVVGRKVTWQLKATGKPSKGNPLGRVLSVYDDNRDADQETLELRLDEAVMRETTRLERFLWLVKVVSVVAPLLGLLGTVTGMIQTFQAITLFGAGDPKMMASGISEALVTTMLGLMVAIPLVLLHALVANSTKRIVDVLDEQSAGLIAAKAESASAGA